MEKEKDMRKGYGKRIWKIRNTTARYMCLQLTLIFISLVCAAHLLTNKYITDFKKFTQFPKHSKNEILVERRKGNCTQKKETAQKKGGLLI